MSGRKDNNKEIWDFEGMATAEKVASSGFRGKLREVQCLFEDCREDAHRTVVDVVEITREGIEARRKNAVLFVRNKDMNAKLVESQAVKSTVHWKLAEEERQVAAQKA